ncbi:hypothetical protein E2C01_099631 [Portunus trituberculatus]|uniref:Transposase Tc1-like domain-containing protein n=1 Tax=Portunus trituberculatus TaxID=210409 RepID=A0A5B7KFV0_PORTR|nr:hypothetical protein [Portunus trituberculatus]
MSVCKWVAIFKKEDTPGYKPRKKYPKKTSHCATNVIKRQLKYNPRVTARKIKESNPGLFGEVGLRTVSCRIHDLGYTSHHPVKKPLLTLNQRRRRIEFCKKYLQWDADKWLDIL